jgi:hypothetical protein
MASVRATLRPRALADGGGHLGHLERVGEPRALVVVGKDEDLCLAGQAPERRRVQDAVAIALEAGAQRVGLLVVARRPAPTARVARGVEVMVSSAFSRSSRVTIRSVPVPAHESA